MRSRTRTEVWREKAYCGLCHRLYLDGLRISERRDWGSGSMMEADIVMAVSGGDADLV